MESNNIELLEAYLGGTLTPEQQEQVHSRLSSDTVFKQDYEMYQLMLSAITENRKAELKNYILKNAKVKSIPFFQTPTFYSAAAASVVLCLISYFIIYKKVNEQRPVAQTETNEVKKEAAAAMEDTTKEIVDNGVAQYKAEDKTEPSKPPSKEKALDILALDDYETIESRSGGGSVNNIDNISSNPDNEKVESDKMQLDTFLFIPRKIYLAKPKQYQTTPNDLYTIITAGDKLKLEVQFWQSPINYSGYKYSKNLLVLYGNFDGSLTSFQELKDIVYMKYKSDYYRISPNETYTGMKKETDVKILTDLEMKEK